MAVRCPHQEEGGVIFQHVFASNGDSVVFKRCYYALAAVACCVQGNDGRGQI